jgi:hypothetical protein
MLRRPKRLAQQTGRHALVDSIPFVLPINSEKTPALMAGFKIDLDAARALLPGNEIHPFRFGDKGLLLVTVVDYRVTDIGKYIEYSIAIACTHGEKEAPPFLPLLFQKKYGLGQYVLDLPVSTEISVKGGKGIWGMPKHQASLDFLISETEVSSQYNLDGKMVARIDIRRPGGTPIPLDLGAVNYCAYRGLLTKSYIYFKGNIYFDFGKSSKATFTLGEHPRADPLRTLKIEPDAVFTAFFPETQGVLDDHFECWFLHYDTPLSHPPEGFESVINLGLGQDWLPAPRPTAHSDTPVNSRTGS